MEASILRYNNLFYCDPDENDYRFGGVLSAIDNDEDETRAYNLINYLNAVVNNNIRNTYGPFKFNGDKNVQYLSAKIGNNEYFLGMNYDTVWNENNRNFKRVLDVRLHNNKKNALEFYGDHKQFQIPTRYPLCGQIVINQP